MEPIPQNTSETLVSIHTMDEKMESIPQNAPRTVEDVFRDFKGRRAGLIRALTTDSEKFYQECDPERENLCLYGLPDETWEVNLPVEEVPPELPEPTLGINFARDGMIEKDWLSLVAVHSDSWLLSVASYFGARFGFGKNEREELFELINELPTVFETLARNARPKIKGMKMIVPKEDDSGEKDEEEDEQDGTLCAVSGRVVTMTALMSSALVVSLCFYLSYRLFF